jgi:transcriptional regulator with XRE-family HTH domain
MSTAIVPVDLTTSSCPFGELLRGWRRARKLSQLDLALEARVSQRHVSFLESGRAQPSREMVLQLAGALDVPLRERNVLLQTAGFAPVYRERGLDSADMDAVRRALEMMLEHHEPLPAVVINRTWDLVLANRAASSFLGAFASEAPSASPINVMRLTFHPQGLQPLLANWDEVGPLLLTRLQREVAADPANATLRALYEEIRDYPAVLAAWRNAVVTTTPPPVLHLEVSTGAAALKLFTMISTFGTAQDVTADELRVESFFAADDATKDFFAAMANGGGASAPRVR